MSSIDEEDVPFEFVKKLGQGSFADVWKVVTKDPSRKEFAVKRVQINRMQEQMTLKQVENLKKVQGENIIQFYEYFVRGTELMIKLHLCDGSLRNLMQKKQVFEYDEIMNLLIQVTAGMNTLNRYDIMHLDLKPDNILFVGDHYKICDFGCSELNESGSFVPLPTKTQHNYGTPRYICPEVKLGVGLKQMRKNSQDVWSFGIILYEVLYGVHPLKINARGDLDFHCLQDFWEGKIEIQFPRLPVKYDLIKSLVKQILVARPDRRPTWRQIRAKLISYFNRSEVQFFPLKLGFAKLKYTIQFIVGITQNILDENIHHNPHQFWTRNENDLRKISANLLCLGYVYCLKFYNIFSFKIEQYLRKKHRSQLRSITNELKELMEKKSMKLPSIEDQGILENQFYELVKKIQGNMKEYIEEEDQWVSFVHLKTIFYEVLKFDSLFCIVHKMKDSCKLMSIEIDEEQQL